MTSLKSDSGSAEAAAKILLEKKIVILPTDTVYGFSGLAIAGGQKTNLDISIDKIKKSPSSKPLIELVASPDDIRKYAGQEIPSALLEKWPGPLTLLVKNNAWYAALTGREATAFRCPGDEWLRQVISLCGGPIYSTSVNYSGQAVLETEDEILAAFGKSAALFVRDGDKRKALPSTLVSLLDGDIKILRQGAAKLS